MSQRSTPLRPTRTPHRARRCVILVCLLGLACVLVAVLWWRTWNNRTAEDPASPGSQSPRPIPQLADSPYLSSMRDAKYVGSQACTECHQDEHASYLQTAHSKSFSRVDPEREPPSGQFARGESAFRFESYRADGKLRHREFLHTSAGEVPLTDRAVEYLVGSGRFARTYLADVDGVLIESPLTWYASVGNWKLSPGFEKSPYNSFCRNIAADCLYCHVGRAEFPPRSEYRGQIHELAIGCERCHGPGSLHVAKRRAKPAAEGPDLTIVHPRHLPRELAEAICYQCHLESEASALVRGRRREEFRPGLRWSDFVINLTRVHSQEGMTVTGHVQQMQMSRCYQASDSLTCITCHNPHATPSPAERLAYYRNVCLECHQDADCKVPTPARLSSNQNDCATCHMPSAATDVPHVAFTHHRIGIHRQSPAAPTDEPPQELVPVLDTAHLSEGDRERVLGVALARLLAQHQNDKRYHPLWFQLEGHLRNAASDGVRDASLETALTFLACQQGDEAGARAAAAAALAHDDIAAADRAFLTSLLARLDYSADRLQAARDRLELVVQWQTMPEEWYLLAQCRRRLGDVAGAIAAYEQVLALEAIEPRPYRELAQLYRTQGQAEKAEQLLQKAELLEKELAKLPN